MSSLAPIPSLHSSAYPASTPSAGALSRPSSATTAPQTPASQAQAKTQPPALQAANAQERAQAAQQQTAQAQQQKTDPGELQKQIDTVLAQANVQTSLQFRVEDDVNEVVVSVVDSDTGETIMQIPNEAALAVAKRLAESGSGLFNQEA